MCDQSQRRVWSRPADLRRLRAASQVAADATRLKTEDDNRRAEIATDLEQPLNLDMKAALLKHFALDAGDQGPAQFDLTARQFQPRRSVRTSAISPRSFRTRALAATMCLGAESIISQSSLMFCGARRAMRKGCHSARKSFCATPGSSRTIWRMCSSSRALKTPMPKPSSLHSACARPKSNVLIQQALQIVKMFRRDAGFFSRRSGGKHLRPYWLIRYR